MDTANPIQYDDFAKLDLRVGTIVQAEPHPNADRLLKLQVDLGEGQPRQVCAGIKQYYPDLAALVGQQIVVVANLAPRTIRGEVSNGMLMAASVRHDNDEAPQDVVVLHPHKPVPPGSKVS